jgi:uncharacterized Zn-binding protein involved in type VI secretion
MPVTVKVNGAANSLAHKGSNGVSVATIPDVCKTPSPGGPIPIPYPNISQSATLANGTTTVKADGMMIAIKGSEFSLSNGDNGGVAGGVKSSTFMKESTWILYSFDVKMDGKNACRLSDKKFQNHENTADLAGYIAPPVMVVPKAGLEEKLQEIATKCNKDIDTNKKTKGKCCTSRGRHKHKCCEDAINDAKAKGEIDNNVEAELPRGKNSRLDVAIMDGNKIKRIYDFKFNCKGKPKMSRAQAIKYRRAFKCDIILIGP